MVVGMASTGCDIGVELCQQGAEVYMCHRAGVRLVSCPMMAVEMKLTAGHAPRPSHRSFYFPQAVPLRQEDREAGTRSSRVPHLADLREQVPQGPPGVQGGMALLPRRDVL